MSTGRIIRTAPGSRTEAFGAVEWLLLASIAGIWGSSYVLIAEALESFRPGVISLVRVGLGAAAIALFPRSRRPVDRSDWWSIAALATFWITIPQLLFPIAQQWISSSLTGMLNGSMPLFSASIAAVLLARLPRHLQAIGLVVGFAGVVAIFLPSLDAGGDSLLGAVLVLVATACYGVAANITARLQQRYGALPVVLRAQLVALVCILPFGLVDLGGSRVAFSPGLALAVLGVVQTGLAFVFMATLIGRAGATRGAIAIYFIPIVALVLGVVFRDETVEPIALVGIGLVVVGAWLTSRREA